MWVEARATLTRLQNQVIQPGMDEMQPWLMAILVGIGTVLTVGAVVFNSGRKIERIAGETKDAIAAAITPINVHFRALAEQRERDLNKIYADREQDMRHVGEALNGLRMQFKDMEIWSRDNFARRQNVHDMHAQLTVQIEDTKKSIDNKFDKLDNKLDRMSGIPASE